MPKQKEYGQLAKDAGYYLELQVLQSAAGFYLGTWDDEGPVSRESQQYWKTYEEAAQAIESGEWIQRLHP